MQELALAWYAILSTAYATIAEPLHALASRVPVPLLGALVLGLLGAFSPCQFTTGLSALAVIGGRSSGGGSLLRATTAYAAGKALVYSLVGLAVILAGQALAQAMIPLVQVVRLALGPLMLLLSLYFLGLIRLRWSPGAGLTRAVAERSGSGPGGAFLLGIAFSFAFCPTLFLLFFGLTIPLALGAAEGPLLPAAFALGTSLPLLTVAALLTLRPESSGGGLGYAKKVRRLDRWLRPAAGVILLLAGLNDTFVYWLL